MLLIQECRQFERVHAKKYFKTLCYCINPTYPGVLLYDDCASLPGPRASACVPVKC